EYIAVLSCLVWVGLWMMIVARVEAVVKQVPESMLEGKPAVKAPVAKANTGSNGIPKTAHVAMLTALENYEVK
ncbi:hypothetical protein LIR30_21155, partial [Blautia wexlerae]|nr:hypothetical protein [Blautia wexlerae]